MSVLEGDTVVTLWASRLVVIKVLISLQTPKRTFYGVITVNPDEFLHDWPDSSQLLWVYNNEHLINVWQEATPPRVSEGESNCAIDNIFGHYENDNGVVCYAVKWFGYHCPTWE
ncbi:hypothetical protein GGTG_13476, partial [Gaeumannomyces tritici R3-111a-1]